MNKSNQSLLHHLSSGGDDGGGGVIIVLETLQVYRQLDRVRYRVGIIKERAHQIRLVQFGHIRLNCLACKYIILLLLLCVRTQFSFLTLHPRRPSTQSIEYQLWLDIGRGRVQRIERRLRRLNEKDIVDEIFIDICGMRLNGSGVPSSLNVRKK